MTSTAPTGAQPRRTPLARRRATTAWVFLTPILIALALVAGWPLFRTVSLSLTDAHLADASATAFIGFENYAGLARDPDWWRAVRNTAVFTVASISIEIVLGLIVALTINAHFRGRGLLRAAVLIPWAIPTVVSAKLWGWMYHDVYGVANELLLRLGLVAAPIAWTADPGYVLPAVIAVDVWKTTPFMALLILAALQMLPQELYEAARVDGVHPVRVFFRITLPLIRGALMVAIIFRALDALRVFDLVYVLTGNTRESMSMSIFARQQLVEFQDVGYGSAASTMVFFVIALFTVLFVTLWQVRPGAER
jgi:trehalose/maltose transport system permease protein